MYARQITAVRYGVTVNLGNYESERVDIEARVEEDQPADDVLLYCRTWIDENVTGGSRFELRRKELQNEIRGLHQEHTELEGHVRQARQKWETIKRWMIGLGLEDHVNDIEDEIPF